MNPKLIDVHAHTQFAAFADDQDAAIQRALDAHIWIINVGTQRDTSKKALDTAEQYREGVYATIGLHPIHTNKSHHDPQELGGDKGFTSRGENFDYVAYKSLALHEKTVGIGECGLDYYRLQEDTKEKQITIFEEHIRLSYEVKKPLMIHCRHAFADLIEILKIHRHELLEAPGVIHFFSGTKEDAKQLLELGFSFSFGGVITFAREYDEIVKYLPLDRILLETDATYVAPIPHRGKRNEPLWMEEVAKKMVEIKGVSFDEIAQKTTENALKIFKIET